MCISLSWAKSQSTDLHLPLLVQKPVISVLKRGAVPLVPKKQDIVTAKVWTGLAFLTQPHSEHLGHQPLIPGALTTFFTPHTVLSCCVERGGQHLQLLAVALAGNVYCSQLHYICLCRSQRSLLALWPLIFYALATDHYLMRGFKASLGICMRVLYRLLDCM